MGISKYLAPALSVASLAFAQGGDGCSQATMTLATGGDVQALAGCQTFTGDVVIETGAVVDKKVSLDGLEKLDGKLTYESDDTIETLSANTLTEVTGPIRLSNLTHLSTIDFSSMKSASDIAFEGLGSLNALGFSTDGGLEKAGNVTIDNTMIQSLDGLNKASELKGLYITNNQNLNEISFDVSSISTVVIGPNAVQNPDGVSFSMASLETADLIIVRNCSSADISALTAVTTALGLLGNTFESFEADNLTSVGALVVDNNTKLKNMSFPALESVNGSRALLEVANNTKLLKIEGFGALKTVNGGVNLFGAFDSASFPNLNKIQGALTVDTSSKTFSCDKLPKKGSGAVRGNVDCSAGDANVKGGTSIDGSSDSSGGASAASGLEIPGIFMSVFAVFISLLAL